MKIKNGKNESFRAFSKLNGGKMNGLGRFQNLMELKRTVSGEVKKRT
jgi:hypothetical protein